jgi:hypothetical protein
MSFFLTGVLIFSELKYYPPIDYAKNDCKLLIIMIYYLSSYKVMVISNLANENNLVVNPIKGIFEKFECCWI